MSQIATDHPLEELTNEEVRLTVHRLPGCRIELTVKTSKGLVQKARKNALKAVSKEISVPGFRKGHAPEEIIAKRFSSDIERELHKSLANLAFGEAQRLARIPVLNNNSPVSFDLKGQSEESAELLFSFETEPKIPTPDPKLFSPKPIQRAEVAEKQIDEAVRQMQFFYAKWNLVQDRPIQEGDYIMIDLDTIEGETVQKVFHHVRFEVSSQRMASWMKKLVLSAKSGDVLEGLSEPDDTASPEDLATFKPKKVRVSILKVEEATLPELTDEFAAKVGAADVTQMRESISNLLTKQVEEKAYTELCEQVNDFLT
ncbi:MAG: trigger factor, partial [Chlamydiota bacterium]